MLESFTNGKINIHDLSVEAPEREEDDVSFDPKKEITREEREKMEMEITDIFNKKQWWRAFEIASSMKSLFPDWQPLQITEENCKDMLESWGDCWEPLSWLFTLFPERRAEIRKTTETWEIPSVFEEQIVFLLLFPERRSELSLTNTDWEDIKQDLEEWRAEKDWWNTLWMLRDIRILFPERFKEFSLTPRLINEMKKFWRKEYLNEEYIANKGYSTALLFAHNLQIIIAEEVKITDKGLELVMSKPKPKLDKIPPQPEMRKF